MNQFLRLDQIENLERWLQKFNDQLIDQSITKDGFRYWETLETNPENRAESYYKADTTLYKGNGGIILYLISVYQYSNEKKYLDIAKQATGWLLQEVQNQESQHFALYTGKTGLCYVLSELYEITQEHFYLETAVKLILQNQDFFTDHYSDDLLSGNTGNMLVIAQLYQQTGNINLRDLLLKCLNNLVDNVYLSKQGLKWRYRPNYIDSLCGLSHGAAGIGFVLTEIGNALNAPGLLWLGQQAFDYEDQYYMPNTHSWPDFRIHPKKLEHPESVTEPEKLMQGEEVSGWAHGSVGIVLTRFRQFIYSKDNQQLQQIESIINHIAGITHKSYNYSLTNGLGSHAYLLAYAGYHLKNSYYLSKAYEIIEEAINIKSEYGYLPSGWDVRKPDLSVFMGETGLAFCILQLLYPQQSGNVVLPALKKSSAFTVHFPDQEEIGRKIFNKYFPQTTKRINKLPAIPHGHAPYQIFKNLGNETSVSFSSKDATNKEILNIEKKKTELEVRPSTFLFLSDCYQRILKINAPFNKSAQFALHEFTCLVETADSCYILVKYRYGTTDFKLSVFTQELLKLLNNPTTTLELSYKIQKKLSEDIPAEKIKNLVIEQLRSLYNNGIIRQIE